MDVLSFTDDLDVLRAGSPGEERYKQYAQASKHFVVIVLNTQKERYPLRKIGDSLYIIPVNAPFLLAAPFMAVRTAKRQLYFQGSFQTDLIDAREPGLSALAAWILARRYRKPLHLFLHQDVVSYDYGRNGIGNWLLMCLARFILPAADAVSTDSEAAKASIAAFSVSLGDRTVLFPRYIDIEAIKAAKVSVNLASKYPAFKFIMLSVGPLEPASNHQLAITTLAGVLRVFPHAGLIIAGDGALRAALEKHAADLGVAGHVAFEPASADRWSLYKSAQVLINCATTESGDLITEACAASLVVVSTPAGEASTLIQNTENGFLCDLNDPACFVKVITLLMTHPEIRDRIRLNAALTVEKTLQQSASVDRATLVRQAWEFAAQNFKAFTAT